MADNRRLEIDITAKDQTKKATESVNKNLSSIEKSSLAVNAAIAASSVAVVATLKSSIDAFRRQERAIFQLEQRVKSTGGAAGFTSNELQDMAASLQQVTTFGDEATIEMQSLLLTFTQIRGPQFAQATEAIQNVATAMGTDLQSAALQVGKALNDPAGQLSALSRSGIQFTDTQKELIKSLAETNDVAGAQNIILAELETQFGGAARAARQGLDGALKVLGNTIGDRLEDLGGQFAPAIIELAEALDGAAESGESLDLVFTGLGKVFDVAAISALTTSTFIAGVGESLGAVGAAISFVLEGEFTKAVNTAENLSDSLENRILGLADRINSVDLFGINDEEVQQADASAVAPIASTPQSAGEPVDEFGRTAEERLQQTREEFDAKIQLSIEAMEREDALAELAFDERVARAEREAALNQIHQDQLEEQTLNRLRAEVEAQRQAAEQKKTTEGDLSRGLSLTLSNLTQLQNSESKKAFEVGKKAAIASTVLRTYESAQEAFTALAGIKVVGPALGAAAAAAAIAAGVSRVQSIKSTQFGGGSISKSGVDFSSVAAGGFEPRTVTQPGTPTDENQEPVFKVINSGSLIGKIIEEEVIPAMNEASRRGVVLEFA